MKKIKITEKQFVKLQEDLEYWSVSDASPSTDTYEMGVDMTEQFYPEDDRSYLDKFDTAFKDFNNPKFLTHLLKELDRSIVIEDVVGSDKIETDWKAYIKEDPFEEHLCYGCTGVYTYPTVGDLNLARDYGDNDDTVSAISIMLEDIFGGEWMDYYYVVNKYLQDRIYKYMKERNYPEKHDLEW